MKELSVILQAANHKPFNPQSEQHKSFMATYQQKAKALIERYPLIHLDEEIQKLSVL